MEVDMDSRFRCIFRSIDPANKATISIQVYHSVMERSMVLAWRKKFGINWGETRYQSGSHTTYECSESVTGSEDGPQCGVPYHLTVIAHSPRWLFRESVALCWSEGRHHGCWIELTTEKGRSSGAMYNDDEARLMSMSAFSFILFLQSRVKFCHVCVSVVVCALWSVCFKNSSAHRRPPWSKNQREISYVCTIVFSQICLGPYYLTLSSISFFPRMLQIWSSWKNKISIKCTVKHFHTTYHGRRRFITECESSTLK